MNARVQLAAYSIFAVLPLMAAAQQAPPDAGLNVSLPLKELRSLLEREKPEEIAPVDVVFGPAAYTLVAGEKSAQLTITADLTLPNARWVQIPLGTALGATSVLLDDQPASVVRKDGRLVAVVDARNKHAAKLKLSAEVPVRVAGDLSSISLPLIPAPIATLSAKLAAGNVNVKAPELLAMKVDSPAGGTTITATLPLTDAVAIQWSPRDARPARVTVQQLNLAVVDRGLMRYTATLQYDILRSPVEKLQIKLPDGVDLTRVTADQMLDYAIDEAAKPRVLTITLKEPTQGSARVVVQYEQRLKDDQLTPALALASPVDVAGESGFVGIEVRGNYEVTPTAEKADRIDVAQLPDLLSNEVRSPLRFGYRYDKPGATFAVALRPLQDLEVLIAMSDVGEVTTTVTPEGKVITKMILVVRNNQKSHLKVTLPQGAQLWSAFVDDRPVTPSKDDKGDMLLPLSKSKAIDEDDEDNYINQRNERRRSQGQDLAKLSRAREARDMEASDDDVSDLKPYDVEIVYISPPVAFADRGQIKLSLPQIDIPVGQLAWAIFLPQSTRIVDATGNIREVDRFSLPFAHFGEAAAGLNKQAAQQLAQAQAKAAMDSLKKAQEIAVSAKAKGVLPVRIEIPIVGSIHRFEKTLSVDEMPTVELTYVKRD